MDRVYWWKHRDNKAKALQMREDLGYENSTMEDRFPPILTPADVMDILHIGKNTMYRLLNSGQLRGIRIGRSWKITADALEAYLLLK